MKKIKICKVLKCQNVANNTYEKWQMDLCLLHLIDFMKWFIKDEKIIAVFSKFCEIWEQLENNNQLKTKKRIKKKLRQLEIYFAKQKIIL